MLWQILDSAVTTHNIMKGINDSNKRYVIAVALTELQNQLEDNEERIIKQYGTMFADALKSCWTITPPIL